MTDAEFFEAVHAEVLGARNKFPAPNCTFHALVEEVGEVSKALMSEPWGNVQAECIQVAAMALRVAIEGDCTMENWRDKIVHQGGYRYTGQGQVMPMQVDRLAD